MGKRLILAGVIAFNLYAFTLPTSVAMTIIAMSSVILFGSEAIGPVPASFLLLVFLSLHTPPGDQGVVFSGFQSSILFFLVVTGVGLAVAKSGLGKWFILKLGHAMDQTKFSLPTLLCFSFFTLSFILPSSVTRNAMLKPLMNDFLEKRGAQGETKRVALTLGMLNALASSALLTGGLAPIVSASMLGGFSWGRWFVMMALPYYLLMFAGLAYLFFRYPLKGDAVKEQTNEVSSTAVVLSRHDAYLLASLVLMVGLWVTDVWHGLPTVVPAIIGLCLLLIGNCISWQDIKGTSSWDTVIILGTMLSVVEAMKRYGVLDLLTSQVGSLLSAQWSTAPLLLAIMMSTILLNLLIPSITVCLTLLLPLFIQLSAGLGLNPVLVGLMITMTVDAVKFYPTQSTPLLMIYDDRTFNTRDVAGMGLFMMGALMLLLFLVFIPYWSLLGIRP